ncbi:MAG: sensor histidine kinase [Lachnospiraceae bacterium]
MTKKIVQSLKWKLIMVIISVLVPLNIFLILLAQHLFDKVSKDLISSYNDELAIYMTKVDDNLTNIDLALKDLMAENWNDLNPSSDKYELTRYNLWNELKSVRSSQDMLDACYVKTNWDNWTVLTYDTDQISFAESETIKQYFEDRDLRVYQPYTFEIIEIDGVRYVIDNVNYYDYSFGMLTKVDTLFAGLAENSSFQGEHIFITDEDGKCLSEDLNTPIDLSAQSISIDFGDGNPKEYLINAYPFENREYMLVRLLPLEEIGSLVPTTERNMRIVGFLSLLLIPIMVFAINRLVIRPLNTLDKGMREIENENMGFRLDEKANSSEFKHMNRVFNHMVDQIQTLRIESYEKDIERLKVESVNLRLQINPHLLLNSLNMIYSLAQSKNYSLITKYSMLLVKYFRYSLRETGELVTIQAEMEFVRNYLEIQKIRFPNSFTSVYEIDENLMSIKIPPLIIQNFVENAMKYALKLGEEIEIIIIIKSDGEYLHISIIDTGNGMPSDVLKKVKLGEVISNRTGEHIGIWNIRRRLNMIYGNKAKTTISSNEGTGTQVWMQIPVILRKE